MKNRILLAAVLFATSSAAFAFCPDNVQKIADRIQSHDVKSIDVTYSTDKEAWAKKIQSGVSALDKSLTINMIPTSGTDVCSIKKSA